MLKRLSRKKIIKNNLLKGGTHKKVLVLCQRKTGILSSIGSQSQLVEETITPLINRYINIVMGPDTTIIYLTKIDPDHPGTADYDCYLQNNSPCTIDFISEHGNSFDLIILQTCPYKLFNYEIVHTLLKQDGYLGITTAPNNWNYEKITAKLKFELIQHILSKNFVLHGTDEGPEIILFKKNIQSAGKNYNRRKSRIKI